MTFTLVVDALMIAWSKYNYDKKKEGFYLFFVIVWILFGISDCIKLAYYPWR